MSLGVASVYLSARVVPPFLRPFLSLHPPIYQRTDPFLVQIQVPAAQRPATSVAVTVSPCPCPCPACARVVNASIPVLNEGTYVLSCVQSAFVLAYVSACVRMPLVLRSLLFASSSLAPSSLLAFFALAGVVSVLLHFVPRARIPVADSFSCLLQLLSSPASVFEGTIYDGTLMRPVSAHEAWRARVVSNVRTLFICPSIPLYLLHFVVSRGFRSTVACRKRSRAERLAGVARYPRPSFRYFIVYRLRLFVPIFSVGHGDVCRERRRLVAHHNAGASIMIDRVATLPQSFPSPCPSLSAFILSPPYPYDRAFPFHPPLSAPFNLVSVVRLRVLAINH